MPLSLSPDPIEPPISLFEEGIFAMAISTVGATLSKTVLRFKPGGALATFEVTVENNSNQFAAFQVELLAPGGEENESPNWYKISPEVCTKTPPGDVSQFHVTILDTPVPGFVGNMTLTVRVFSVELRDEERQVLRLLVEQGTSVVPMRVSLPARDLQAHPGELIEIKAQILNPTQSIANVVVHCVDIPPSWLPDGSERRLQINPGAKAETSFLCQIPSATETENQIYPFRITAAQPGGPPGSAQGGLEVLPKGVVEFQCTPTQQQIPSGRGFFGFYWKNTPAIYKLQFENISNITQEVSVDVMLENRNKFKLEITPETAAIKPGEVTELLLTVSKNRRWFGVGQKFLLEVKAKVSDDRLGIRNDTQLLKLRVMPVIPPWVIVLLGALMIWIAWLFSWLNTNDPFWGHKAAVNTVLFNGVAGRGVSGSNDRTMINWRVFQNEDLFTSMLNKQVAVAGRTDKAVRALRYRPTDNDFLASGLENGQVQLWNLVIADKLPRRSYIYQRDDRVFDLEFSADSARLFSGHGSGLVLEWDASIPPVPDTEPTITPLRQKKFGFAVYSLRSVGTKDQYMLVGGRFNRLMLWNQAADPKGQDPKQVRPVLYRDGTQDDYIMSIARAGYRPNLVATSDNQGYITLWDMQPCLEGTGECRILDQWREGHGGRAVRSVSLGTNGCYLVSGGDDGRVMLWPLTAEGKRAAQFSQGKLVNTSINGANVNSVDLKVLRIILVISGGDDTQVRIDRIRRIKEAGCDKW